SNADSNEDRAFTGNCTSTGKILAAVVKVGVGQEWSSYTRGVIYTVTLVVCWPIYITRARTRTSPATTDSRKASLVGPRRGCCRGRHWHKSEPMRSGVLVYRQDGRRSTVLTAHGNSRLARVERPSR
ncbi:unnamed protein product, partial [Pylaiella littoralis]